MIRSRATRFWCFIAALFCALGARAEPRAPTVVVFGADSTRAPPGFVEAITIQLAGVARVSEGPLLTGSVQDKLAALREPLHAKGGKVGLWVERVRRDAEGETAEFLVYLATRREDTVLVQVVRLPGPESSETERALALKVREVLEAVLAGAEPSLARGVEPAPPAKRATAREGGGVVAPLVDAALLGVGPLDGESDARLGVVVGGGARVRGRSWQLEALGRAGTTGDTAASTRGTVEVREVLTAASLRALWASSTFAAGAFASGGGWVVHARGEAPDGPSGEATRFVPTLAAGPEARAMVGPMAIRLALGVEVAFRRQRFAVRGHELMDAGTWRGLGELGVALALE